MAEYKTFEEFQAGMQKHKDDFIQNLQGIADPPISRERATVHFDKLVSNLWHHEVKDARSPGNFVSAEKARHEEEVHADIHDMIKEVNGFRGLDKIGLWSQVGRFAVEDPEIEAAAGAAAPSVNLESTRVGKMLEKMTLFKDPAVPYDRAHAVWAGTSKEFAAQAKGEIDVYVPTDIGAQSIFWGNELPALRQRMAQASDSPSVSKVTLHHLKDDVAKGIGNLDMRRKTLARQLKDPNLQPQARATLERELRETTQDQQDAMRDSSNWEKKDIMDAAVDGVPLTTLKAAGAKWRQNVREKNSPADKAARRENYALRKHLNELQDDAKKELEALRKKKKKKLWPPRDVSDL